MQDVTNLTPYRVNNQPAARPPLLQEWYFSSRSVDPIIAGLRLGTPNGWLSLFQDNWLVVIFKLHAGFNGVQSDLLHVLNPWTL